MTSPELHREIEAALSSGRVFQDLARRVAFRTESQRPAARPELYRYLKEEIGPSLERLGFRFDTFDNPQPDGPPFLIAERIEGEGLPTVLMYGHGDVVNGDAGSWADSHPPFALVDEGERWYGRGTADNKGQHTVNLIALELLLKHRPRLGYNIRFLMEMGEEQGSPGLRAFCTAQRERLRADLLIASDGPRWRSTRPTIFLGARGFLQFELVVRLRENYCHSGNWGGLAANPGTILAHAITALVSARGEAIASPLRPRPAPAAVTDHLAAMPGPETVAGVAVDPYWGQEGVNAAQRVLNGNGIEVQAFQTGDIDAPQSAIPPVARAFLAYNHTVDFDTEGWLDRLRAYLAERGLGMVEVRPTSIPLMPATRSDPTLPVVQWARDCLSSATGGEVDVLPNMGGALPNDIFADDLGLTTLWVPHSYPGCQQHAGDEHILTSIVAQGLHGMAALLSDLTSAFPRRT